jgi:hypothetical protein
MSLLPREREKLRRLGDHSASLKMECEIRSINQSINSMIPHFVPADVNDSVYNAFDLILLVTRFDPDYEILMTSP